MTLGIAWIRPLGDTRELVVASDSRLCGGQFWDANPKILLMPRSDCVLSFAGDTFDAYPLMIQAQNAISMFRKALNRGMDLPDLKGHLLRIFNHSRTFIHHPPVGQKTPDPPGASFILAGYSWRKKAFLIWQLHYDTSISKFTFRPIHAWPGQEKDALKLICYIGDADAITAARASLIERLRGSGKLPNGNLDMEPFEVLRDIIRSGKFPSVGGSPQIVKLYEHMNTVPFGVYWPDRSSGQISVLGRPLMGYEKVGYSVIDPDDPAPIRKISNRVSNRATL